MKEDYQIIIEPTQTGFSAYSADLQGCITVRDTIESTRKNMLEAIELYLEELTEIQPFTRGVYISPALE